ncbi:MAG TPA: DUF3060 domain-containing protein [Flavobacterium sp.]|nr:DUF3060 domain-containing protein [Flavobacterium sp.]
MKKGILILGICSLGLLSFNTPNSLSLKTTQEVIQDEIVIEGVGVTQTIETTGKETIRIEGTNNKITISGSCHSIKIEGVDNIVTVADVKTVTIEGTGNKVTYKSSSNADGKLIIKIEGVNNKIEKL